MIGNRESGHFEFSRAREIIFWLAEAVEERKMRVDMEVRETHFANFNTRVVVKFETSKMPKAELFRIIPEAINWTQLQLQSLLPQFQITPETTRVLTEVLSSRKIRENLARLRKNPVAWQTAETLILAEFSRIMIQKLF